MKPDKSSKSLENFRKKKKILKVKIFFNHSFRSKF